ncbi:MAG TPA: flavohemoglobin expression-modulating QEGLA motif protein [Ensifer sp.]|jgi:uncharacterized protein (TIGR02421 family)|uniref:flavohemoglobin expression-modulating QEGLA motif protein n=1 Tax=Ensifer sp. TaxID=1872086 RepID=UPI002E156691|nr:flavohemoglobin expression-modulating QEGLA motif protein [Ensifer sp.]
MSAFSSVHMASPAVGDVLALLEKGKRIRLEFDGGRLHIDRPLPYLCVHIGTPDAHPVARELAASQASYLLAEKLEDVIGLIKAIAEAMRVQFGAFVLLDVDELQRDRMLSEDAPYLQPFEVTISATQEPPEKKGAAAFVAAVEAFEYRFRKPRVELFQADEDACVRPGLLSLNIPLLTLRFAPIYRVPSSEDIYPELKERLVGNLLDASLHAFAGFVAAEGYPAPPTHRAFGRKAFIDAVERADRSMDEIASSFDFLMAVTPINASAAWLEFKEHRYQRQPSFLYRPLTLMVEREKRRLYSIPLDRLEDPVLHQIYREKRQELDIQLSLIAERERERFMDFSRALYGSVEQPLLAAAHELLDGTAKAIAPIANTGHTVGWAFVEQHAREMIGRYRQRSEEFDALVEVRDDVPPGLMVSGRRLVISRRTEMMRHRVEALLSHEVGVHLLTYFNGSSQGLRVFRTGLAGYEGMQEGLAVFAEYLVGGFTRERLRQLALRVVGCDLMLNGVSFVEAFRTMTGTYGLGAEPSFGLLLRIYRGGGFAKDAIYLRGLLSLLAHLKSGRALDPFWMGKISSAHFKVMEELGARGLLKPPVLRPICLEHDEGRSRLERARAGLTPLAMLEP